MDKKENKTAHKRKKFQGATPAVAVKLPRLQRMQWANIVLTFDKVFMECFSFATVCLHRLRLHFCGQLALQPLAIA